MDPQQPLSSASMDRFAVILWEPQDPINIGAVVRSCRNTEIRDLRLVRPAGWNPEVVLITAPRCEAFIETIQRYETFADSVVALHRICALTARGRREKQRRYRIDELVEEIAQLSAPDFRTGFVFGREDAGLPNGVVDRCDAYISIETSEDYASLNLAQAVLMVVWSLFKTFGQPAPLRGPQKVWSGAPQEQVFRMMDDIESALDTIGFFKGDQRENVLRTVRQVLLRAEMDTQELATFWGIFKEVQRADKRSQR